jgi:hypothetical protein
MMACTRVVKLGIAATALAVLASTGGACGRCGPETPAQGSVSLAWSLTDPDGQPIACDRVGAAQVSLSLRNVASGDRVAATFPCAASPGTQLLAPGVYETAIALRAADSTVIATAADQDSVVVVAGQLTPLAPVSFTVRASLVISFATAGTATNCAPASQGGTGITGTAVILVRTAGGCAPVTFIRKRGGAVVDTYTVNCSSPRIASCIERDETLTVPSIDPDSYLIALRGRVGSIDCWGADAELDVRLGAPLTRTIDLAPTRAPGCPEVQLVPRLPRERGTQ